MPSVHLLLDPHVSTHSTNQGSIHLHSFQKQCMYYVFLARCLRVISVFEFQGAKLIRS